NRHLWVRTPRQTAVMRVRAEIIRAARNFFDERGFTLTDPPILTPAACEGTSTLFEVDYFDEQAFLTQSGQLYIEAMAMALGKVYSFGPTFRAEEFISHLVQSAVTKRKADLDLIGRDVTRLANIKPPFPRITYDEAVKMLQEGHAKGQVEAKFEYGGDFGSPDETYISSQFDKPVMVHRYPAKVKAFYMEPDPQRPDLALCVDVLAPE